MKTVFENNDVYYQVKERPDFLARLGTEKSGLFCVQFDLVFFAKQSEGNLYRLGEKIKIAQNCLSCKFTAGHLLNIDCGRWEG